MERLTIHGESREWLSVDEDGRDCICIEDIGAEVGVVGAYAVKALRDWLTAWLEEQEA